MKKIITILVLSLFSFNLFAKERVVECNYVTEFNINNNDELAEEEKDLINNVFLPLNLKIYLKYIDINNWNINKIETQVDELFSDFKKIDFQKQLTNKEAVIIHKLILLGGMNIEPENIMNADNEARNILPANVEGLFQGYRKIIDEFIYPNPDSVLSNSEDIDPLTGKKLNNYIILRWTLDSGILIRNKFEFPNIINESTTNATLKMVGTDGGVLLDTTGTCYNSNPRKQENKISVGNGDDTINKLKKLKLMFEDELITQEEYDDKRKEILDEM